MIRTKAEILLENRQEENYFKFLCTLIFGRFDTTVRLAGNCVMRRLHSKEFYELVPYDNNRGEDGKKFREIFLKKERLPSGGLSNFMGPCTVLEMILGLANRMSEILYGEKIEDNLVPEEGVYSHEELMLKTCFWTLLENLGLDWIDNKKFFDDGVEDRVNEIIDILLTRKYCVDGNGGLFPLKNPKDDQTKVEIWYQMHAYLIENY